MKKPTVLCLGPECSWSHLAGLKTYPDAEFVFTKQHTEALNRFISGEGDYAILPVSNTNEGAVLPILKGLAKALLNRQEIHLVKRIDLPIRHCLAKKTGFDSVEIRSHSQALGQCSDYVLSSGLKAIGVDSTSLAAKMAAESDGSIVAICSKEVAIKHGLKIVSSKIVNRDNENITTFHVLSRNPNGFRKGSHRTELFFFPENKPGALHLVTAPAASAKINLCDILSFRLYNELVFYAVLEGKPGDDKTDWVLDGMRRFSKKLLVIGSYETKPFA